MNERLGGKNLEHSEIAEIKENIKKARIDEFLELSKTVDLIPSGFCVDRMRELPMILERAREHAETLRFAKVVPCDVCIENFIQDRDKRLEIGGRIFGEAGYFSAEEMTREVLEELYPEFNAKPSQENGRVRVHGITRDGKYQTYCYFCDDDMCLSQVKEGPDWDKLCESRYREFLPQLPELLGISLLPASKWETLTDSLLKGERVSDEIEALVAHVRGFYFSGSTSWLVNVDLLVDEGQLNREYVLFTHEGRKWTARISTANDPIIRKIGYRLYKPIR